MAIGPERAIGTGPIGEGPIGPQPDAQGDVTFGWHQPWLPPLGVTMRRTALSVTAAAGLLLPFNPPFIDNTVTIDKWQQPLGERARPIPRSAPLGGLPFVPKEATVDNTTVRVWPLTFGEKARPILRVAPQGYVAFGFPYEGVDNTRIEWDWTIAWPDAVPIPRAAPVGGSPFVPAEATVQNTTNRVWPLTQGAVGVVPPKYVPNRGNATPFVPAEATVNNTTNKVWPLITIGERARPIARVAPQGAWTFGYPYEAVTIVARTELDWLLRWQGPPRMVARHTQPVLAPRVDLGNNVTFEKWGQPLSFVTKLGWPRSNYLRGGSPFVPKEATVQNTVPGGWWQPLRGTAVPPRPVWWTQPFYGFPYEGVVTILTQEVSASISFTATVHICGWGTEPQETDPFATASEQATVWTVADQEEDESEEEGPQCP